MEWRAQLSGSHHSRTDHSMFNRRWLLGALLSSLGIACGGASQSPNGGASAGAGGSAQSAGSSAGGADASGGASVGSGGSTGALGGRNGAGGTGGAAGTPNGGAFSTGGTAGAGAVGGGAAAGGAMPTVGCASWQIETQFSMQGTATIVGGALELSRPVGVKNYDDGPTVTQTGLSGDFDITVTWQDFMPGDSTQGGGPTFHTGVFWTTTGGTVYSATSSLGGGLGEASIIHGQQFTNNSLPLSTTFFAGASGSFRLQRAAGVMTVTTTINGQAVTTKSTEPFTEEPLRFSLWMNDNSGSLSSAKAAGVTVTGVAVNGGGGLVKSDDFSCP